MTCFRRRASAPDFQPATAIRRRRMLVLLADPRSSSSSTAAADCPTSARHVLQRGRLGAGAAQLPRLGRLRHRADADRQARRQGRSAASARTGPFPRATAEQRSGRVRTAKASSRWCSTSTRRRCRTTTPSTPTTSPSARTRRPRRRTRPARSSPPPFELFNLAKQNGVAVFFITGRRENTRATPRATSARGLLGLAAAVLKPTPRPTPRSSTRAAPGRPSRAGLPHHRQRRRPVLRPRGGHEDIGFKLANPFYFLP